MQWQISILNSSIRYSLEISLLPTRTLDVVLLGNMHRYVLRQQVSVALLQRHLQEFSIAMRSTSDFRSLSVRRLQKQLKQVMK